MVVGAAVVDEIPRRLRVVCVMKGEKFEEGKKEEENFFDGRN